MQPFRAGDRFADHARPIGEVMAQLTGALHEYANFRKNNPGFATSQIGNGALSFETRKHAGYLEHREVQVN